MSKPWPLVPLEELLEESAGICYGIVQPGRHDPDGVPIVRVADIVDNRVSTSSPLKVSHDVESNYSRSRLHGGEILLTVVGTVGRTALVPPSLAGWNTARAVAVLRLHDESLTPWVLLVLQGATVQAAMRVAQTDTVQATLNLRDVRRLLIPLPPPEVRHGIAGVLGALDHLIDTNIALAHQCDDLTAALWLSFFGGSDPCMAVENIASVVLGGTPSRARPDFWGGSIAWLNSGKANEFRVIDPSEYITEEGLRSSSTKMMPGGTTLVAITGATLGQISRTEIDACGNQSLVGIYSADSATNDFLFFAVRDQRRQLVAGATGGAQQHINKANVERLLVPEPTKRPLNEWHERAQPLLRASGSLLLEAKEASATRDELLPLLLSGRVLPREVAM